MTINSRLSCLHFGRDHLCFFWLKQSLGAFSLWIRGSPTHMNTNTRVLSTTSPASPFARCFAAEAMPRTRRTSSTRAAPGRPGEGAGAEEPFSPNGEFRVERCSVERTGKTTSTVGSNVVFDSPQQMEVQHGRFRWSTDHIFNFHPQIRCSLLRSKAPRVDHRDVRRSKFWSRKRLNSTEFDSKPQSHQYVSLCDPPSPGDPPLRWKLICFAFRHGPVCSGLMFELRRWPRLPLRLLLW